MYVVSVFLRYGKIIWLPWQRPLINKKHLKNVGLIHYCEHSPGVASGTVMRRLRIDVHDANDDDDNGNA